MDKRQKKDKFLVKRTFSLEKVFFFFFLHYHFGAAALAISLILGSGTRLWKKHQLYKRISNIFKMWTSLPTWQVSSLFNLHGKQKKQKTKTATCGQHGARVCFCLLWIYRRTNKLENCQVLFPSFCPIKDQFLFLLMLKTYSVEVRQK